jgi:hypothetical protein
MARITLLAGVAAGILIGAMMGRDALDKVRTSAKEFTQRPEIRDAVRKADAFVAEKAPTLHGVGEAVVDAASRKPAASRTAASSTTPTSTTPPTMADATVGAGSSSMSEPMGTNSSSRPQTPPLP